MKEFSKAWKSSKKPKKQRKYVYKAPLHIKGKLLGSHLSEELSKKLSLRSVRVRKGDKVKVMRGQFKGKVGKIERVDVKDTKVYVANVEIQKKDGGKSLYPLHPSNLLVLELASDDKKRFKRVKAK